MAARTETQVAMPRLLKLHASIALVATLALAGQSAAQTAPAGAAQAWPARPLRLIVNEAAGTAPDLAARALGEGLARALGQAVRVENREGDEGVRVAAGAAPNGYNWLYAPSSVLTLFAYTTDLVPYSPEDDFAG